MSWSTYTGRFGARRPRFLPAIDDPERVAAVVRRGLDWMSPDVRFGPDEVLVRLTMPAPSAEAALAHLRGSFRSALNSAKVPQVGLWPLFLLSVEHGGADESRVGAARIDDGAATMADAGVRS